MQWNQVAQVCINYTIPCYMWRVACMTSKSEKVLFFKHPWVLNGWLFFSIFPALEHFQVMALPLRSTQAASLSGKGAPTIMTPQHWHCCLPYAEYNKGHNELAGKGNLQHIHWDASVSAAVYFPVSRWHSKTIIVSTEINPEGRETFM